jgi:hypothetical protein
MIRIGDKKLIYQTTLVLPDATPGELEIQAEHLTMKVKILFQPEPPEPGKGSISWEYLAGTLQISFRGFNSGLGTAPTVPLKLGTAGNGESIGLLFFQHKAGNMNRIDFLLLLGGVYE